MSPSALARPMLRQSRAWGRMATRRFESTQTTAKAGKTANEAASKAKDTAAKARETASEYSAKAAEGLSRVTSTAGPVIAGAAKNVAGSLSKVGGRTGKIVALIEKHTPTALYYSKVAAELAKIVFRGRMMSPPSLSALQTTFQTAYKRAARVAAQEDSVFFETVAKENRKLLQQTRNLNRAQLVAAGVLLAECLGFFTVGEMIGRFKIIGYHGGNSAAHH